MQSWFKAWAMCTVTCILVLGCGGVARDTPGGGAAGASGVAGSSGTSSSAQCVLPQVVGSCEAAIPSFWHNPITGLCEPFVYGGCEGNANRFATREACLSACPSSARNWGACQADSDCALTTLGCCGACEPIPSSAFVAVSSAHLTDVRDSSCKNTTCGACLNSTTVYEDTGKYFKPVCSSGQCSVLDIRESELTACASDSDCELRDGASCCPSCGGQFVALSTSANVCPGVQPACGLCISERPSGLDAACRSGHCQLALPTR